VNRRLVLAGVIAATAVVGGLASTASAASPETNRHKLCIVTPGNDPIIPGYCITWDTPKAPAPLS
jgi:hypothetical protein